MNINGAGVLPVTAFKGAQHFLLGEEGFFFRNLTDLGGSRDPGEMVWMTAAREAYEEGRGALGSRAWIFLRLLWPSESVTLHQYRSYLYRCYTSSVDAIPKAFRNSSLHGGVFNEMNKLIWVKSEEVYQAAMQYNRNTVSLSSGRALSRRLVGVIRRTKDYRTYAARQVARIVTRHENVTTKAGNVAVVLLRNGRVFAADGNRLVNRTWMNPQANSLLRRIKNVCLWMLLQNPYSPRPEEREAILHALKVESLVHRFYRHWLTSWSGNF